MSLEIINSIKNEITEVAPYSMDDFNNQLREFFKLPFCTPFERLQCAANFFLNKPYFFEPLGEGENSLYSQEPLYRTDKFDCVTYVDTVLSLYRSQNLTEFKNNMIQIRYHHGKAHYTMRTDWFTDLEWIPRAQQLGWIKDITQLILDESDRSIYKIATTYIDKKNWYAVKPLKVIHLLPPLPTKTNALQLLTLLRAEGNQFQNSKSNINYLPLSELFKNDQANVYLFDQIPSACVIIIVRPDWKIKHDFPHFPDGYGTNLNVSHLGIGIRFNKQLLFYNASSLHHQVEHENLIEYLAKYINHPSIKGIHVEQII